MNSLPLDSDPLRALSLAVQAVKEAETAETRSGFARAVLRAGFVPDSADMRALIGRAMSGSWTVPRFLFNAAAVLIKKGPCRPFIERAVWAWPKALTEAEMASTGPLPAVYSDALLKAALQSTIVSDLELEKFLTAMRRVVLEKSLTLDPEREAPADLLAFASALARQCYINEYVFRAEKDEKLLLDKLMRLLKQKNDAALAPLWIAAAASYMPLAEIPSQQLSLGREWPAETKAIIQQQVTEPEKIDGFRESITRITAIDDDVSLAVQHQYEENPYPRWVQVPSKPGFLDIRTELIKKFPYSEIHGEDTGGEFRVLVAGCGTGQQLPEFSSYPNAKTLGIDLSLASLAYAKSKIAEFGLGNIELAQADILKLDLPAAGFDLIVSTGVLHHMEDPEAGWRKLVSLLRPGGFMLIGLYSELARQHIAAARDYIAAKKIRSTANAIRNFRQDVIASAGNPVLGKLLQAPDFYSLSECRDLLFHVQEQRFTIPRIMQFLTANGLTFLGFENTMQLAPDFGKFFPEPQHRADLNRWHAYEMSHPDTFACMYNPWLQKRSA